MHSIIDIRKLADKAGTDSESVRKAGQSLFASLAGDEPDLTRALSEASASSGLQPDAVRQILTLLADEFRQPLGVADTASKNSLAERVETIADKTTEGAIAAVGRARETLSSIDISSVKTKGTQVLEGLRDEVAAIDVEGLKDRASSAGKSFVARARSLAGAGRPDEREAENAASEGKD